MKSDINELNKQQVVLLCILVAFVTSIATGITVVSVMQQSDEPITQTINNVIEKTVEKVVPVEKIVEVPKSVPSESERIKLAAQKGATSLVSVVDTQGAKYGLAVVTKDKEAIILLSVDEDRKSLVENNFASSSASIVRNEDRPIFSLVKFDNTVGQNADIRATTLESGETIVSMWGLSTGDITTSKGYVSKISDGYLSIHVDVDPPVGATVFDSNGSFVGFVSGFEGGLAIVRTI